MDVVSIINRRIGQALAAIRLPFRAVLTRITSDGGVMTAQLDGLESESLQALEVFQQYGLTSVPPAGTMAVVIPVGGSSSHGIVVATENSAYRLQALEDGEVAIYTSEGAAIVLKNGKIIESHCDEFRLYCKKYVVNASDSVEFNTPQLTASQNATVKGLLTGSGGMSISGDNGSGVAASFAGDISHTGGTITSVSIRINGVEVGTHRHQTPDGMSDGPQN
ncbi:TPA: phage baseplate assembly protein V [Salmonella enterica]|nr:phage baseplate assembly protein V [Salmonella enterica]MCH5735357.1 phage baseplate assembly protein V [Salmonella enterica]MCH5741791.1 phage baseplate assembly protein V [Salmonella enterica]MCH5746889.1 phage baseplate assembly protein V [Salmonella enterica]MCH5757071.1 phage baseplate assembly protein V [Salmonella enterica]